MRNLRVSLFPINYERFGKNENLLLYKIKIWGKRKREILFELCAIANKEEAEEENNLCPYMTIEIYNKLDPGIFIIVEEEEDKEKDS